MALILPGRNNMTETMKDEKLPIISEEYSLDPSQFSVKVVSKANRNEAHDNGLFHPVTLIVPINKQTGEILTTNKFPKDRAKAQVSGRYFDENLTQRLDIFGGHITMDDLSAEEIEGGFISFETIRQQAFRELTEELRPRKDHPAFSTEGLFYLGEFPYFSKNNCELAFLFGYRVEHEGFCACDDYFDKNGQKCQVEMEVSPFSLQKIMDIYNTPPEGFMVCDGLGRLLEPEALDKWARGL